MSKITYNNNGDVRVDFDNIKKITIDHITDVISHRIMRVDNLTVHDMEFIRDGRVYLSYTLQGKIVECTIKNMATRIDLDNDTLVLQPQSPPTV